MAAPALLIDNEQFALQQSGAVAVAAPIAMEGIDAVKPHCFLGANFSNSADFATEVLPSAGSIVVEIQTVNNEPNFESPPIDTIDASDPTTLSWAGNTQAVTAVPTGIVGAAFWRITVTCNET